MCHVSSTALPLPMTLPRTVVIRVDGDVIGLMGMREEGSDVRGGMWTDIRERGEARAQQKEYIYRCMCLRVQNEDKDGNKIKERSKPE